MKNNVLSISAAETAGFIESGRDNLWVLTELPFEKLGSLADTSSSMSNGTCFFSIPILSPRGETPSLVPPFISELKVETRGGFGSGKTWMGYTATVVEDGRPAGI